MSYLNRHLLGAVTTTIFSTLGFVFALLAITSKEWVLRNEYESLDPLQWTQIQYTLYRSPFIICTATAGNVSCDHFAVFGNNTSCESISHTGDLNADNSGDARLCQQIHLAGHLALASTSLILVGFLSSLVLLAYTVLGPSKTSAGDGDYHGVEGQGHHGRHHGHHKHVTEGAVESNDVTSRDEGPAPKRRLEAIGWSSSGSFLMLICLSVDIITTLLSQFYAILGLIQSAPNNADFASSHAILDPTLRHEDAWFQGKALSTYESCAWGLQRLEQLLQLERGGCLTGIECRIQTSAEASCNRRDLVVATRCKT